MPPPRATWSRKVLGRFDLPPEVLFLAHPERASGFDSAIAKLKEGEPVGEELVELLPDPLKKLCQSQRGLRAIDTELRKPVGSHDDAKLISSLQEVHRGNPELGEEVRQRLVVFAEKKGQPELADKLRNITFVKEPALPQGETPVDFLPIPEAAPAGLAGQQESPFRGLEDLGEDVSSKAKRVERQLKRELEHWSDSNSNVLGYHLWRLHSEQNKEESRRNSPPIKIRNRSEFVTQVRTGLSRELRSSEKLLIADMFARNYTPEQVVAELRDSDKGGPR
jgi:hypothetical protein